MTDGQNVQVGKQGLMHGRNNGSGGGGSGRRRGRRRGKGRVFAGILVLVIAAGAAGVYVVKSRNASSLASDSKDSLAAAAVNIAPGDLPGWKGVPGTIAGVLGAAGFTGGTATSVSASAPGASATTVATTAAAAFAQCTKVPVGESDAALAAIGFSNGLPTIPGMTALSASPVFEDPTITGTSAESSAMVLATTSEQGADMSVFSQPVFAACFGRYLDTVLPSLVGGALSGSAFGSTWVAAQRIAVSPTTPGVVAQGFGVLLIESGHPTRGYLYESVDVISAGRMIAVTETISPHPFPGTIGGRLISDMELNVSGES